MVALGGAQRLWGCSPQGWQCQQPPPWFLVNLLAPGTFVWCQTKPEDPSSSWSISTMAQGLSWCQGTEGSFLTSLRIVCEIGDASLSKVHEARVEVCIRDCSPNYRATSPKSFTFVVSPVPGCRAGAGWFGVVFLANWKTGHHFPVGQAGISGQALGCAG